MTAAPALMDPDIPASGEWPLLGEEPYIAECPAGGHDAAWVGRCYGRPHSISSRSLVSVDCRTCP